MKALKPTGPLRNVNLSSLFFAVTPVPKNGFCQFWFRNSIAWRSVRFSFALPSSLLACKFFVGRLQNQTDLNRACKHWSKIHSKLYLYMLYSCGLKPRPRTRGFSIFMFFWYTILSHIHGSGMVYHTKWISGAWKFMKVKSRDLMIDVIGDAPYPIFQFFNAMLSLVGSVLGVWGVRDSVEQMFRIPYTKARRTCCQYERTYLGQSRLRNLFDGIGRLFLGLHGVTEMTSMFLSKEGDDFLALYKFRKDWCEQFMLISSVGFAGRSRKPQHLYFPGNGRKATCQSRQRFNIF